MLVLVQAADGEQPEEAEVEVVEVEEEVRAPRGDSGSLVYSDIIVESLVNH